MMTLFDLCKQTVWQFGALFGVFLAGGFLLTCVSKWTCNALGQFAYPRFALSIFGVIGVPVHELSHAVFCQVFLHDIKKVKWFDIKGRGGAQGSVEHAYNPWNLYHRVGHFFIGLGPAIFGPFLLAVLFYALVPSGRGLFRIDLIHAGGVDQSIRLVLLTLVKVMSAKTALTSVRFYIFLYLAICICSQIELSPEDLKQVGTGVVPILLVLFLANILAWALGANWHTRLIAFSSHLITGGAGFFAFAVFLSSLNLLVCTAVFGFTNRLMGLEAINPFRTGAPSATADRHARRSPRRRSARTGPHFAPRANSDRAHR